MLALTYLDTLLFNRKKNNKNILYTNRNLGHHLKVMTSHSFFKIKKDKLVIKNNKNNLTKKL